MSDGSNLRFELNHSGEIVERETELCANLDSIIVQLFSQNEWVYQQNEKTGSYRSITITNTSEMSYTLNVYSGSIRNESRNPYEKKIQLSGKDPKIHDRQNTIIIGVYVFNKDDNLSDAIIVGYPIDSSINYESNPSLRGVTVNRILQQAKLKGFFVDESKKIVAFRPEFIFYYLDQYMSIHYNESASSNGESVTIDESTRDCGGANTLLYGVPGSGKSYTIQHEYCDDEERMERLVFHPDYTFSDFVGQILPNVSEEGIVSYKFSAGPFTNLLKKAYENPGEEYYLVIEEINRGNAPAIFGEVFQLLDRDENGTSEYGISNSDIARIVYGDEKRKVRIPSNMSIIGTMNTSDQNVFTLDTAFQRRWRMLMIENNVESANHADAPILDTGVKWKSFNRVINNQILENSVGISSAEDKRLGAYFIGPTDLVFNREEDDENVDDYSRKKAALSNSRFPEKILKYLWDDAFKFSRSSVFDDQYRSLEEVVKKFNSSRGTERFSIFKPEILEQFITRG